MEGIKIDVTGNIARVIEKPTRITSGTVGMPAEFTFDSQWDGLSKVAVFRAGDLVMAADIPEAETTVPWELLDKPNVWLSVGVYGVSADGSVVIPTTWANVSKIHVGVDLDGDHSAEPTPSIWQKIMDQIADLSTKAAAVITKVTLRASAWEGSESPYSQVVTIDGVTEFSKVDLLPSVEQLAIFHNKDLAFVTENEDGVVTVYAIGDKPTQDYTMQVQITEVVV